MQILRPVVGSVDFIPMVDVLSKRGGRDSVWLSAIVDPLTIYFEALPWHGNQVESVVSAGVAPPAGVYAALCRETHETKLAVITIGSRNEDGYDRPYRKVIAHLLEGAASTGILGFTLFGWIRPWGVPDDVTDAEDTRKLYDAIWGVNACA